MDKLITELEGLNHTVITQLDRSSYEDLSDFVEKRQPVIDALTQCLQSQSMDESQKRRIVGLLEQDTTIQYRMMELKQEASNWLKKRDQAKTRRSAYESAYAPDSILMDRRE